MDLNQTLKEIGLSQGEAKVYLALLKLGPAIVSEIKEETNLHRTTIYDFIEKLLNKGLINYVIKNNIKHYNATQPDKLLAYIKEKEEHIKGILPSLTELQKFQKEELKVEVYKGREGFKTVLNDMLRTKKNMVGFGVDEEIFKKRFPILIEQHFKREQELGITERLLSSDDTKFVYEESHVTYRFIPKEYFNPTPTVVYGDKVVIIIWEPLTIIMIENSELAEAYRKQFEMLWGMAKQKI
jgi:sugar-specific transcriptional regulator TrmB